MGGNASDVWVVLREYFRRRLIFISRLSPVSVCHPSPPAPLLKLTLRRRRVCGANVGEAGLAALSIPE